MNTKILDDNIEVLKRQMGQYDLIPRDVALRTVNIPLYMAWRQRKQAEGKAAAVPMPGPTLGAFMDKAIDVQGIKVLRLLPVHIMGLQKIGCKLLGLISPNKEDRMAAVNLTAEEDWDACYIFTKEPNELYDFLVENDAKAIRKESARLCMKWPQEVVKGVCLAIMEQIKRYAENQVKIVDDMQKAGNLTFFQEPGKTTPATKTDAVG